ncbi:MAG: zinc ribbon domain-containing protein [Muribaculaceae bacterium]|nr:zinc ribbon domain-containing protein [Muribaculaceae bacterium]
MSTTNISTHGEMRKCPACGAPITGLSAKCPECGHEFTNINANTTVRRLIASLNNIDATAGQGDLKTTNSRKVQIIRNFPIPNTKEDVIELLSLCQANMSVKGEDPAIRNAWKTKAEQLITKSEIILRDDKDAQHIISRIREQESKRKKKTTSLIIGVIVALLIGTGIIFCVINSNKNSETQKVEGYFDFKNKAAGAIKKQQYEEAVIMIDSLNQYVVTNGLNDQYEEIAGDTYLKLVIALLRDDRLEDAAMAGLDYREKLNDDYKWRNSQIFKLLVQECEAQNVDDSPLR